MGGRGITQYTRKIVDDIQRFVVFKRTFQFHSYSTTPKTTHHTLEAQKRSRLKIRVHACTAVQISEKTLELPCVGFKCEIILHMYTLVLIPQNHNLAFPAQGSLAWLTGPTTRFSCERDIYSGRNVGPF